VTTEPTIHERAGWRWINRCPVCNKETCLDLDDLWWCDEGHHADMPNQEIIERPNAR
jgi:hypothetical protein